MKRRIVWYIFLILAAAILQFKLVPHIRICGVAPNFFLVLAVAVGAVFGQVEGAVIGLISGLVFDCQSVMPFGVYALLGFFAGFLAGIVSKSELKYMVVLAALAAAVLTFFYELILFTVSTASASINWLSGMEYIWNNYLNALGSIIWIAVVYNTVLGILFYLLMAYVIKKRPKDDVVTTYTDS